MARSGSEGGDDFAFLKEALGSLSAPGLRLPMLLCAVVQPACNFVMLSNQPTHRDPDHGPLVAAFAVLVVCYVALAVAMLRILNRSPRPAWHPDRSVAAYGVAALVTIAIGMFADWAVGQPSTLLSGLATAILYAAIVVPFSPWLVAIAVERPLAWRPAPWFRGSRSWLPALLLWSFLILVPANAFYRIGLEMWLDKGGQDDWLFYVTDGVLTAVRFALGLALVSVAYRRVARL
jgi:hypothetical protein